MVIIIPLGLGLRFWLRFAARLWWLRDLGVVILLDDVEAWIGG